MVPDVSKDHNADIEPVCVCGPLDLDLECQVRSDRSKRREPTMKLRFKLPVRRLEVCVHSVSVPRISSIFSKISLAFGLEMLHGKKIFPIYSLSAPLHATKKFRGNGGRPRH